MPYAGGMRRAVCVAFVTAALAAGWPERLAIAQSSTPRGQGQAGAAYKPTPLNLQREQLGSAGLPDVGRARMRAGDWVGALDAFDAALRSLIDPTIYRDRGICHEQLGHVYPAIDDYRRYLTDAPDAPDAEGVTARLRKLEDTASGRTKTASTEDDDTPPGLGDSAKANARVGSGGGSAHASLSVGGKATTGTDKLEYQEPEEDVMRTPLRGGKKGMSLAPFFAEHKWFAGSLSTAAGDGATWTESVGIQFRYVASSSGALVLEAGFEHFNGTSIDPAQLSGLTSLVGYELRFPLDPDFDNQILLMPALGYEHLSETFSASTNQSLGAFVPRLRIGFRHLIKPSTAVDFSIDGGAGNFFTYDKFPFDSSSATCGLIAANISVAWGL
jgi:hypothetical protein